MKFEDITFGQLLGLMRKDQLFAWRIARRLELECRMHQTLTVSAQEELSRLRFSLDAYLLSPEAERELGSPVKPVDQCAALTQRPEGSAQPLNEEKELTPDQLKAIRQFAMIHGRTWKHNLGRSWITGRYGMIFGEEKVVLEQIKNQFGQSWLTKFKLPK